MKADLRTNCYRGESVHRFDVDLVIHTGPEWGDEVGVGGVEGGDTRDVGEEVLVYKLVLWTPDFPSVFVEDGVKMRVVGRRVSTRRSFEKVWEKVEVVGDFVDGAGGCMAVAVTGDGLRTTYSGDG